VSISGEATPDCQQNRRRIVKNHCFPPPWTVEDISACLLFVVGCALMSKLLVGFFVTASMLALSGLGLLGLVLITNLIYLVVPPSGMGQ